MNVVVFGGTRGIGRAVARRMAVRGDHVCLLGRHVEDLQKSAADLDVRGPSSRPPTAYAVCDLEEPDGFEGALARASDVLGGFDTVVVTAGLFASEPALEQDLSLAARMLAANFSNTLLFCERARAHLLARGGGTLCVCSSVAGERGRSPVVLYGAAKAGLTRYLEGLDHRFYRRGLRVVCVKPGFVKTSMTVGLPVPPFAGEPERVARDIVRAIDHGWPVVYTPGVWALVMLAVRMVPRFIMRRTEF